MKLPRFETEWVIAPVLLRIERKQLRIKLPLPSNRKLYPFFEGKPQTVWTQIGKDGQLVGFKSDDPVSKYREKQLAGLKQNTLTSLDMARAEGDELRFLAGAGQITCSYESRHIGLTLPGLAAQLGVVPQMGESVILLVTPGVVEFWRPELWKLIRERSEKDALTLIEERILEESDEDDESQK